MKTEKIKGHLAKLLAGDSKELGRLARELGHELPRKRLEMLAEFRAILADCVPAEDRHIRGYLAALADVSAAYSAAIQPEADEEEAVKFLRENSHLKLKPIMLALLESHGQVEVLANRLSLDFSSSTHDVEERDRAKKEWCGLEEVKNRLDLLCRCQLAENFGEPPCYLLTLYGEHVLERLKKEDR